MLKLLVGYAIEFTLVEGGIEGTLELAAASKLGGIPRLTSVFLNTGSFNSVCGSTPNLSSPSFSNKAVAAALGFVVRGGKFFEVGAGDGFERFGLGVMVALPLDAKFGCHGLTVFLLVLSALEEDGE